MERAELNMVAHYRDRGLLEEINGDVVSTARAWLDLTEEDLAGVQLLVENGRLRMAYRSAYDIIRNAAEAIVTRAGYRITSAAGHHEAVFALANVLVGGDSEAFSGYRSAQSRGRRSRAQYIDVDVTTEVTRDEAETAYAWAKEAVAAARTFVGSP